MRDDNIIICYNPQDLWIKSIISPIQTLDIMELLDQERNSSEMNHKRLGRFVTFLFLGIVFVLTPACDLSGGTERSLYETMVAIEVLQTNLEQTSIALTQLVSLGAQATPNPSQTAFPNSTGTVSDVPPVIPQIGTPSAAVRISESEPDERLMKSAKILLFEDMSASGHIRYVKEALDDANFFYLDVGSAKGWFKSQLLSNEEWDLIIAAAEARRDFGGEFLEYIDERVALGAGAVVEYWNLDYAPAGRSKSFLDRCGVKLQVDWFEPELRVFFWLVPEHPIFHQPNQIANRLSNGSRLWTGDIGDLLELKYEDSQPVGDAVLLAGTNGAWKTDHGTLVSCLGGRVILQTFSSHEYNYGEMLQLWQNYIYQALKNHFTYTQTNVPTPAVTIQPDFNFTQTPSGPTPGPAYSLEYRCGTIFNARIIGSPVYQKDLFEHHAQGEYLHLKLQLMNLTEFPIQIWDEDYFVEGVVDGQLQIYSRDRAATGYLYIENPVNLSQDLIDAGEVWQTAVAFDVPENGKEWMLVVKPGSEFNEQVCELRIPLTR